MDESYFKQQRKDITSLTRHHGCVQKLNGLTENRNSCWEGTIGSNGNSKIMRFTFFGLNININEFVHIWLI